MAHHAEDISKIEDIGERLDALLDALEESSEEVARASSSLEDDAPPPPRKKPEQPKPAPESTPEPASAAPSEPEQADVAPTEELPEESPAEEPAAEADDGPVIDDGLLIEPEAQVPPNPPSNDVDGAPVGSDDLERELDEELASLLASGVFEDPVGEMGTDESADPVELPDEDPDADARAEAELLQSPSEPERKPNLPTDEAELIGELDEQLAALADAQLEADEPAPKPVAPSPEPQIQAEPAEPKAPEPEPAAAPAPEPATAEPAPAPAAASAPAVDKPAWRAAADRVLVVAGPVVVRVAKQTGEALIVGARRASAPLDSKPQLKQIVGWVALVQAFLATCVWVYLALWHNPPQPPTTPQPSLQAPADG